MANNGFPNEFKKVKPAKNVRLATDPKKQNGAKKATRRPKWYYEARRLRERGHDWEGVSVITGISVPTLMGHLDESAMIARDWRQGQRTKEQIEETRRKDRERKKLAKKRYWEKVEQENTK